MGKKKQKMVRDLIPDIIRADNHEPIIRVLDKDEYIAELFNKLEEEVEEVLEARDDTRELTKEIEDVYEVIDSLLAVFDIEKEDVVALQASRRESRGGFSERIYLEDVK